MKDKNRSRRIRTVYIIAGPNGAGKTTFALRFLPEIAGCRNFINADLIARGLSPLDVDMASMEAGRIFLRQIQTQIAAGHSFAFETTLAGLGYIRWIHAMRQKGYKVRLYYLWIPTIELALKRIAERVKKGGHDIPGKVARRRYTRGIRNLFRLYLPLTDYCAIFDNSSAYPVLVYEKMSRSERILRQDIYRKIVEQEEAIP